MLMVKVVTHELVEHLGDMDLLEENLHEYWTKSVTQHRQREIMQSSGPNDSSQCQQSERLISVTTSAHLSSSTQEFSKKS